MILPSTYSGAILCLVVSLLCLGSWANLLKTSGKWRYELFYLDFSLGVGLVAILASVTLGSLNSKELTFQDNLLIAGYRKMAYAAAAGVVANAANLLLAGAISVLPLSVAYPIAGGVGFSVGVAWMLFPPQGSVALLVVGGLAVIVAVTLVALTYRGYARNRASAGKPSINPRASAVRSRPRATKSGGEIALCLISGMALGMVPPLLTLSRTDQDGLAAYSAGLIFGLAVAGSTVFFAPFFLAFPVRGEPVSVVEYLKGSKTQHLSGVLAGLLWIAGSIAGFTTWGNLSVVQVHDQLSVALADAVPILASLWGLLVWREFRGSGRLRIQMAAMLFLWIAGGALVVIAASSGPGK